MWAGRGCVVYVAGSDVLSSEDACHDTIGSRVPVFEGAALTCIPVQVAWTSSSARWIHSIASTFSTW